MSEGFRGPAARRFDWQHIFDSHSDNGPLARQSKAKTVFTGLSEAQIKACVMAAWRNRNRIRSQFDPLGRERILYRGTATRSRAVIEIWYNVETQTVETAYPVRAKQ